MEEGKQFYSCQVEKTDNLVCYTSGYDSVGMMFAVVAIDKDDRKVSVLLSKQDVGRLQAQIAEFLSEYA